MLVAPAWLIRAWPMLPVTLLGLVTAFYALTAHGLWGDEVWSASWSQQQSLPDTFSRFLTPPDLPLNFILVRIATGFGQDDFWVRLPSALLGAATVTLLFALGRRIYGTATGAAAAVLLAVAPYHVWYSQDARPYAPLAFYSLLSLYCFWRLLEHPSAGTAAYYAAATVLNLYNHLFGLFPLLVEVIAGTVWGVVMWRRTEPPPGEAVDASQTGLHEPEEGHPGIEEWRARRRAIERSRLGVATAIGVCLVLCIPLYRGLAQYITNSGPSEVPAPPFHMTATFVTDLFSALGSGTGWPFWVLAGLFLIGVGADAIRRHWFAALGLAWLAIPLLIVWLDAPRHLVNLRYFLFLQPVFLLLAARGLTFVAAGLAVALHRVRQVGEQAGQPAAVLSGLLTLMLALAMLPPTLESYRVERTNNWSALCSYLHAHAERGALISGNLWAPSALSWCFRQRTTDRRDVVVSLTAGIPRSGHAWYFLIGPTAPGFEPGLYTEVPHSTWAPRGLEPATGYGTRLPYPQSEIPGTLYHH